jgi:hypothetical protein
MQNYINVFDKVYNIALSEAHSLFVALDREAISAVILDGNTYWTEAPSVYSDGLTDKQHKQLAEIMAKHFNATYLYEEVITA